MAPERVQHRSCDGGLVTVEVSDEFDLSRAWFGHIQFRPRVGGVGGVDESPFGTNTGPKESVEVGVASINGGLRSELTANGGTVRIYDGFDAGRPLTLSAWIGDVHAAWAFHYQPDDTDEVIRAHYSRLRMDDDRLGLRVSAPGYEAYGVRSYKRVPGVGTMAIHPGRDAAQLVPRWQGARVGAGELWRQVTTNEDWSDTLLVASSSAVVTVIADDDSTGLTRNGRNGRATRFAEALAKVSWDD